MTKLYIKQKVFSLTEHFDVFDANENTRFRVDGSFFKIPKQFRILDATGNEVAIVKKEMFHFLPHFSVLVHGTQVATIAREMSFFGQHYSIDAGDLKIKGDWWNLNFSVSRGSEEIAQIRQKMFSWGNSYEVDIQDENAQILIIALVIAINTVKADEQAAKNTNSTN